MGITARALRRTSAAAVLGASIAAALSVAPLAVAATPPLPSTCANVPPVPVNPPLVPTIPFDGTIVKTVSTPLTIRPDKDPLTPKDGFAIPFAINEAAGLKVWDIDLNVHIEHTVSPGAPVLANDIHMTLFEPSLIPFEGPSAVVTAGALAGTNAANTTFFGGPNGVTFDDQASLAGGPPALDNPVTDVPGDPAGAVVPEEAFGGFRGRNASGTWQLHFRNPGADSYRVTQATMTMRTYAGSPESPGPVFNAPMPGGNAIVAPNGVPTTPVSHPALTMDLTGAPGVIADADMIMNIITTLPAGLDVTLSNEQRRVTITTGNGAGGGGAPGSAPGNVFDGTLWNDFLNPPAGGAGVGIGVANFAFNPATPAPVSTLVPEGAMSAFVGDAIGQKWTLTVTNAVDPLATDAVISGWSLAFKTTDCAPQVDVTTQFLGPNEVPVGTQVTQRVVVTNSSDSGASGVVATVVVPDGLVVAPQGCPLAGPQVVCNLGIVPAHTTRTFDVKVTPTVSSNLSGPVAVYGSASISRNEASDSTANNSANAFVLVRPFTADLSVTAAASPASNPLGGEITYTAAVSNAGPDSSEQTWLDLPIPPGATLIDKSSFCTDGGDGVVRCNFGTRLSGDAPRPAQVRLKPSQAGPFAVDIAVHAKRSGQIDPNHANNKVTVTTNVIDPNPVIITTPGTTIINNLVPLATPPAPPAAKTWPSQVRFTLKKAGKVRITVLTPGGRKVVGRILVFAQRGQNVVVLPSRLKKYLGPKKPVVRVVKAGAGFGLVGAPDATLILVEKLGR